MAFPPHLAHLVEPARDTAGGDTREPGPDDGAREATWSYAWPAGERMAAELAAVVDCRDLTVADLGCGRGHLGLTALTGGAASVLFADGHGDAIARLDRVIAANGLAARARAARHEWGDPLPDAPFDVILGGDVLYRPECFAALVRTIAGSLAAGGRCLLSDPRLRLEDELADRAAAAGLAWSSRRRDGGYTLLSLRRA
ncbi:MAG TPA: methyltransferase domain-containing protein [Planctomycetota bacterium]|nr:methyltransferase domain-containing protein [Planctomycetota bacterium]